MRKLLLLLAVLLAPAFAADKTKLQIVVTNVYGTPVRNASVIVKFIQGRAQDGEIDPHILGDAHQPRRHGEDPVGPAR